MAIASKERLFYFMQSLVLGRLIEPAVINSDYGRILRFGVLSGRNSHEFSVFEYNINSKTGERNKNKLFDKASAIKDNSDIAVIINSAVTKSGSLGVYLRDVAVLEPSVRSSVSKAFSKGE